MQEKHNVNHISNIGNGIVISGSQDVFISTSNSQDFFDSLHEVQKLVDELNILRAKCVSVQAAIGVPVRIETIDEAIEGLRKKDKSKFANAVKKFSNIAVSLARDLGLNILASYITSNWF